MKTDRKLFIPVSDIKLNNDDSRTFTCYGNVKGVIDHAQDMVQDGAYSKSIENHKTNGTMPMMFYNHKHQDLPVGPWLDMVEDSKGLRLKGKLSNTTMGNDLYELIKDNAIGSFGLFSIGYNVIKEKWNSKGYNELIEIDIKEVSIVNFACNEHSGLLDIKNRMSNEECVSKADLRTILRECTDLSKRNIERITAHYSPETNDEKKKQDVSKLIAKFSMFD